MSKLTNNMTPCVQKALSILKELYSQEASRAKVNHLLLAFGANNGHLQRINRYSTKCTVSGVRAITAKDVAAIKSESLQRKVADFLLNNQPARDTDVLAFINSFGWSEFDTTYTTQQHASLSSKSLVTRAAYIAIQQFKNELDEFYANEKAKKAEVEAITFTNTTETVDIFNLEQPKKRKYTKKSMEV